MTPGEDWLKRDGQAAEGGDGAVVRYGRLRKLRRLRVLGRFEDVEGVEGNET
jgi:hypothetical protein